jgi:hypothetical protein
MEGCVSRNSNHRKKEATEMRKLFAASILCVILAFGATAQAFWVGSVFDNSTASFVSNVMGFDWSSSGSGLVVGEPKGAPLTQNQTIQFLYQASLVGLTDPLGAAINFPGLKTSTTAGFEYTVVAQVPELAFSVTTIGGLTQAFLTTLSGGTFALYNQAVGDANVSAGTGFNNGTLVATGTINPGQLTTFTGIAPATPANPYGTGLGSTILEGLVTFANPAFLDPALTIVDFRFEGQLNAPPLDSEVRSTGHFFDGNDGFAVTPVAGLEQLKVDGSSKFSLAETPEPSTILLLGVGLLGVAGFSRKRIRS